MAPKERKDDHTRELPAHPALPAMRLPVDRTHARPQAVPGVQSEALEDAEAREEGIIVSKKNPTTAEWQAVNVHNPHNLAERGPEPQVYIAYRPAGRLGWSTIPAWLVQRVGYKTDPEGHWMDYGAKSFTATHSEKAAKLAEAQAWAGARYGITEWERSVFGSWHPKGTMTAAYAAPGVPKAT